MRWHGSENFWRAPADQQATASARAAAEVSGIVALLLERNPKLMAADIAAS